MILVQSVDVVYQSLATAEDAVKSIKYMETDNFAKKVNKDHRCDRCYHLMDEGDDDYDMCSACYLNVFHTRDFCDKCGREWIKGVLNTRYHICKPIKFVEEQLEKSEKNVEVVWGEPFRGKKLSE